MQNSVIDGVIEVPQELAERLKAALVEEPSLDPDIIESAGAEGGGGAADVVVTLSKAALGHLASVLSRFASGHDITFTVGQTTLHATRLRRDQADIQALVETVLDAELKRLQAEKRKQP